MASNDSSNTTAAEPSSSQLQQQTDQLPSSSPVEMTHLSSQPPIQSDNVTPSVPNTHPQASNDQVPQQDEAMVEPQRPEPAYIPLSQPNRTRQDSEAIGPPAENNAAASSYLQQNTNPDAGPAVLITLILLNGARHPFKIDQKYLKKRNIVNEGENMDPYNISVYTMKELIWRDWREDWVARPTMPGAIRLIYFGKLLDDKQTLSDCRLQPNMTNAVHMTVRPQEFIDDEENAKGSKLGSSRMGRIDDGDRETGCRCCLVM